jgi:hypothetical protein
LIKENTNKTFDFKYFSLRIECQELSDRSLQFRDFYEFTPSGRQLARIVVPSIAAYLKFIRDEESDKMKRFNKYYGDSYSPARDSAEGLLMPTKKKRDMAVGQIIHFIMEKAAAVRVLKTIYTRLKGAVHIVGGRN